MLLPLLCWTSVLFICRKCKLMIELIRADSLERDPSSESYKRNDYSSKYLWHLKSSAVSLPKHNGYNLVLCSAFLFFVFFILLFVVDIEDQIGPFKTRHSRLLTYCPMRRCLPIQPRDAELAWAPISDLTWLNACVSSRVLHIRINALPRNVCGLWSLGVPPLTPRDLGRLI